MWDEYYDMYNEPSELDMIVEEALDKIQENVKEVMRLKLEKLAKLDEDIDEKSKELSTLKYKLSMAQMELSKVAKKTEELEDKIPARYVDRFIHNAIGNFAPGDKVWVVKEKYDSIKCDMCDGIGKVRIVNLNNDEIACPGCYGRGTTSKSYYVVEEDKVNDIYLKLCFDRERRACLWNTENIYLESSSEYSTSIKRIFDNEQAAQEECNRLNNKKEIRYD